MRPIRLDALLLSLLLIAGLTSISAPAAADPGDLWRQRHRLDLGLYAGVIFPPRAHELYDQVAWQEPFDVAGFDVGLRVGYMPWPFIGLELEGGVVPTSTREGGDSALLYTARAHVIGQYPAMITPFLLAGYGILGVASGKEAVGDDVDGAFHAGLGLKLHAIERLTLRLDGRIIVSGSAGPTGFMPCFEVLAGVSYMLFATEVVDEKADSDGDGVPDKKDRCPKKAARTTDGCPPRDSDGDGIIDEKDACPKRAARTKDGCPVKDSDGDGVPDKKDKCPNQAARTADGCPVKDSDGDGVPDKKDTCPRKAARTADGCPVKAPPATYGSDFPDVTFWFNRAALKPDELPKLKKIAETIKQSPSMRVQLRGYADEVGPRGYNRNLSLRRAVTVRWYLMSRGVKARQLSVRAMGERPGRGAKNRRVQFKIIGN